MPVKKATLVGSVGSIENDPNFPMQPALWTPTGPVDCKRLITSVQRAGGMKQPRRDCDTAIRIAKSLQQLVAGGKQQRVVLDSRLPVHEQPLGLEPIPFRMSHDVALWTFPGKCGKTSRMDAARSPRLS